MKTKRSIILPLIGLILILTVGLNAYGTEDNPGNIKSNAANLPKERVVLLIEPRGVALDLANNHTLAVDGGLGALVSVDLTTGNRTIISDTATGRETTFRRTQP